MKRLALIAITTMALSAQAEFVANDNGAPSHQRASTVHEAKTEFGDNAHIVLEGYITGSAGTINPEEYFFKDDTDTIKVEINPDVWRGQKVTPQTKIRIAGEVDVNHFNNTREIEVRRLDIVK